MSGREKVNPSLSNYVGLLLSECARSVAFRFPGLSEIVRFQGASRRTHLSINHISRSTTTAMADWRICPRESRGLERRSKRDEDFEEGDVWGFVKEKDSSSCMSKKLDDYYSSSSSSSSSSWRQRNTAPRMIQKANHTVPNLEPGRVKQSSAPLDIPDWSKIYGKNSKMGFWVDDGDIDHGDREGHENEEEEEDDDDDDEGMVPPHEWIAKKLARTQISSFSVCEGVGRTLKGRDLSKLRNAILTKTGFLE